MKTLFSVVIPIYNVEKYLVQCLESVVNQTFKDIEIILVDDCSPDNCIKICKDFAAKDNRIKIIQHKKNLGLGGARNTGIDHSSGEYIFFLDSDDWLELDLFEKLAESARKNNYPDLFLIDFKTVNQKTGEIIRNRIKYHKTGYIVDNLLEFAVKSNIISACMKCARLSLYCDFRFLEKLQAEDIPSFYLFYLAKNIYVLNYDAYNYRVERDGSIVTTTSDKMHYGVLVNTNYLFNLLDNVVIDNATRKTVYEYFSDRILEYDHIAGYFLHAPLIKIGNITSLVYYILLYSSKISDKKKKSLKNKKDNSLLLFLSYFTIFAKDLHLEFFILRYFKLRIKYCLKNILRKH